MEGRKPRSGQEYLVLVTESRPPQTKVAHAAVCDASRDMLVSLKEVLWDLIERSRKEKAVLYAVHGDNPAQVSAAVEQAAA